METWQGHRPITSAKLLPILERATAGDDDFSRAERILYTTCEFWAAVAARSILTQLGSEVADDLGYANVAFNAIGATHVANSLTSTLRALASARTTQRLLACLSALENELLSTQDPVDDLIATFALKLHSKTLM